MRTIPSLSMVYMMYLYLGLVYGRTINEIIASASKEATSSDSSKSVTDSDSTSGNNGNGLLVELDMMLTEEQYSMLYGQQNIINSNDLGEILRNKRKAIRLLSKRWPNGIVPFSIQTSFTAQEKYEIKKAFKEWEKHTCITFIRKRVHDLNFVRFEDDKYCASDVGMIGGKQKLSLGKGCRSKGTISHEIGHAIGFFHEQNRPDRDNYVIIKEENIIPNDRYNFRKYDWNNITTYNVPYDYTSLMHYGANYFTSNGKNTIETIDPAFQSIIGRAKELSFNDIKLANLMYNCKEKCLTPIKCPNEGFLGKDCKCWCTGNPIKECYGDVTAMGPLY